MSVDQDVQESLTELIETLKDIHDHKIELLETLSAVEIDRLVRKPNLVPIATLANWVKADLHSLRYMIDTFLEICKTLRGDIKRKKRNEEEEEEEEEANSEYMCS